MYRLGGFYVARVLRYAFECVKINYGSQNSRNFSNRFNILLAPTLFLTSISISLSEMNREQEKDIDLKILIKGLSAFLEEDQIETTAEECASRGKPWSSYHKCDRDPEVILYPRSTKNVSDILSFCNRYKFPIIPFGGGTSIEGQTLALQGGVSLDFSQMKNIISFNEQDLDCVVEAGLGYVELNEYLADKGLWFPLDPGPGACVGGMCACRCSGSTALRYGSMRENVLYVTAVLADGTIIKTGSRARKSSAGYDITRLLVGSEGTLAVITEACLKLHTIPKVSYALRVSFPSVGEASLAARECLVEVGIGSVGRIEMLDDAMVKIVNSSNSSMDPWPEDTTLLIEVTGPTEPAVTDQLHRVREIAKRHRGDRAVVATSVEECKRLWMARKECLWSAMGTYPDRQPMITDVCVPLSQLPEIITRTKAELAKSNPPLPAPIVAHAGKDMDRCARMFCS